jgi:putative DNA methylase
VVDNLRKKLIEVALPLEIINKGSIRENYIYKGNPSSLHKWWAQRPLAAARAVIFAQMVDDPSSWPELFKTEKAQEKERKRLFKIIEDLVIWENINNITVIENAKNEIWESWRRTCTENVDNQSLKEIFNRKVLPAFHDPFSGGGTLPLEAQRLGLKSFAADLNPVSVLINKSMIEIPTRYINMPPINPSANDKTQMIKDNWKGTEGMAADIRYFGLRLVEKANDAIGHLYPKIEITSELADGRKDLKPLIGKKLDVISWLWVRTVESPNPAFAKAHVPLAPTFVLSTRPGREVYVKPIIEGKTYKFRVLPGKSKDLEEYKKGTKVSRGANFNCLLSGTPIEGDYIKEQGVQGKMRTRLMAIVAESELGRVYISPAVEHETIATELHASWKPDVEISGSTQYIGVRLYGMNRFDQIFLERQLVAMDKFTDLVSVLRDEILECAKTFKRTMKNDLDAEAYANAIATYVAFAIDKHAMYGNALVPWYTKEDRPSMLFTQQVLPMVWDPVEVNPFCEVGGSLIKSIEIVANALSGLPQKDTVQGSVQQVTATQGIDSNNLIISTDPPYYDNVPYADLSDFFYIWLRKSLKGLYPNLFTTITVPKAEELVAFAYRHNGKDGAESFFLDGMTQAMNVIMRHSHPAFPVTIYYAFRQSEKEKSGNASTGWETFLEAVIKAGFSINGTWPMRTERTGRMRDTDSNALASSIILVCRARPENATSTTRREFINMLKSELPAAIKYLQNSNIAPVDLAQSAIGPGMSVYSRFLNVIDAQGKSTSVREALSLINQTLDEVLAEQEGDFDADSRWALAWFEQQGFKEGEYGLAETLSKAKNTSVNGLVEAGILESSKGKVRLLKPQELPEDWDPLKDKRLTEWEIVHHLIRVLEKGGESVAAEIVSKLGSKSEIVKELAYRLYNICERKKRATEALSYNSIIQSWQEILKLAGEKKKAQAEPGTLFDQGE